MYLGVEFTILIVASGLEVQNNDVVLSSIRSLTKGIGAKLFL
jgi:hypothetical protein